VDCLTTFARLAALTALLAWTACSRPDAPQKPAESAAPALEALPPIPKFDVHLHVAPEVARATLRVLMASGVEVGFNASGGEPGMGMEQSAEIAMVSNGRLLPLCNLTLTRFVEPDFEAYVSQSLERCSQLGGRGVKISKFLGLGLVDPSGKLIAVDDPRLDPVFDHAGRLACRC